MAERGWWMGGLFIRAERRRQVLIDTRVKNARSFPLRKGSSGLSNPRVGDYTFMWIASRLPARPTELGVGQRRALDFRLV